MILVDSSVWIGHFRREDAWLVRLLRGGAVLGHAFVLGELACGGLPDRAATLRQLRRLPQTRVARPDEVLDLVERHGLSGIGYVDAHLLAAAAARLGLAMTPDA